MRVLDHTAPGASQLAIAHLCSTDMLQPPTTHTNIHHQQQLLIGGTDYVHSEPHAETHIQFVAIDLHDTAYLALKIGFSFFKASVTTS